MIEHRCPVKGHDHNLLVVRKHVQRGTGSIGYTLECPSGMYRWLLLEHHASPIHPAMTQKRPRWGWKINNHKER
jgi:hypothetical protein